MAKLDATHALDLVAGGDPDTLGMGDRSINRSIGSQWKDRKQKLLDHADEAKKKGKKNNVKLEICGDKAGGGKKPASQPQSPGSGQPGTGPSTAPMS
jgi:Novel toxin 15